MELEMTIQSEVKSEQKGSKKAIEAGRMGGMFYVEPERALIIGHDTAHKSKAEHHLYQERAHEPVDEALAANMAEYGFTSTIQICKDGPNLEVVVGRRRVKAARRANEIRAEKGLPPIKVKCEVVRGTALQMALRMVSENALRKDVHPLDMAADCQGLLDIGASPEQAAMSCGKTLPQFRALLKLLDLDVAVQAAIRAGDLSVSAGIQLADLTREQQKAELAKNVGSKRQTAAQVSAAVKARKSGSDEAVVVPGKRLITKLLESDKAEEVLGKDGIRALRFAIGELSARNIAGLTDLIREIKGE
jgi:ParB family transcriptional regulator, chromosome partitioning protein